MDEVGYEVDQEYSTSSQTQRTSSNGFDLTGWIEVANGETFYLKNFIMPDGVSDRNNMIYWFNNDKSWGGTFHCTTGNGQFTPVFGEDGYLKQFTVGSSGWTGRYIRINCTHIDETSIITRGEPID